MCENEEEGYSFNLAFQGGASIKLSENVLGYVMIYNQVAYGGFLPHNYWTGMGGIVGIYADFGDFRLLTDVEKLYTTSDFADKVKYKLEAVYSLNRNSAVALNYTYEQNKGHDLDEFMTSFRLYF